METGSDLEPAPPEGLVLTDDADQRYMFAVSERFTTTGNELPANFVLAQADAIYKPE
jgi:hypothetical protein